MVMGNDPDNRNEQAGDTQPAAAAPSSKQRSSTPRGSSLSRRATSTSPSTPSPLAPGPASPCSTAAGRPAKTCCAPPSATAAPPMRLPFPTPAPCGATSSRCAPRANTMRNPMAALVSSMLGSYYNQAGPTPAELREAFLSQRGSAVEQVVQPRRRTRGDRPSPARPPDHRPPLRPVPNRNHDDAQACPRPRPAPDR